MESGRRFAEAGVVASVGSRGDSYDNALAESFNGLYKAEPVRHRGRGSVSTASTTPPWNTSIGSTAAGSTAARHDPARRVRGDLLRSDAASSAGSFPNKRSLYKSRGGSTLGLEESCVGSS